MTERHLCDLYTLVVTGFHALDTGTATSANTTDDFRVVLPRTVITGVRYTEFLQSRAKADYITRHCVSNFRLVDHCATSATAAYVVTAYRLDASDTSASVTVADFVDEWIRPDQQWLHRARSISPAMPVHV